MGETLYRGPEILFRWGRLCFDTESPEGRFHISQGETLFRGRLYFVTPAAGRKNNAASRQQGRKKYAAKPPPNIQLKAALPRDFSEKLALTV